MSRDRFSTQKRLWVSSKINFDTHMIIPENPQQLILLLHGFAQTGEVILKSLLPALPSNAIILAPNGPFPMPYRKDGGWRATFAWYFYDPATDFYLVEMQTAVESLQQAIQQLGFDSYPKRWIGFSQGGYLAPFAAQAIEGSHHIIGIGCEYLADELSPEASNRLRIDGIHGARDETIPLADAQSSHQKLLSIGFHGKLKILSEASHQIDDVVRNEVENLLTHKMG